MLCMDTLLWRYCGMVVLQLRCGCIEEWLCYSCVVAVLWCSCIVLQCILVGGTRLYFAQWRPSRVYILHNGMLATFTFLHNGIRVCVFAQWYSSTNALKMQAFCFKWLMSVIYFTNFVKTNAIR